MADRRDRAEYFKEYSKVHKDRKAETFKAWSIMNKEQRKQYNKEWRMNHPTYQRLYRLKETYGWSEEKFNIQFAKQRGLCSICLVPLIKPNIDHCHLTGCTRDILCSSCNQGLGHFKDDPALLKRASEYLKRHALITSLKTFLSNILKR